MMQDHNAETLEIVVPGEDGPIAEALAELESKLAAFTDAMRAATTDLSAARAAVTSDNVAGDAEPAIGSKPREADVRSEPVAEAPDPPRTPDPVPTGPEPAGKAAGPVQKKRKGIVSMVPQPPEPAAEVETAGGAPPATGAAPDEDETLLASLDAETAAAIRVMRRVSVERKSVRELLEQYRAGHTDAPQSGGDKKSWWTRGRR